MVDSNQTSFMLSFDEATGETRLVSVENQNQTPSQTQFVSINNENLASYTNISGTEGNSFITQNNFATMNASSSQLHEGSVASTSNQNNTSTAISGLNTPLNEIDYDGNDDESDYSSSDEAFDKTKSVDDQVGESVYIQASISEFSNDASFMFSINERVKKIEKKVDTLIQIMPDVHYQEWP